MPVLHRWRKSVFKFGAGLGSMSKRRGNLEETEKPGSQRIARRGSAAGPSCDILIPRQKLPNERAALTTLDLFVMIVSPVALNGSMNARAARWIWLPGWLSAAKTSPPSIRVTIEFATSHDLKDICPHKSSEWRYTFLVPGSKINIDGDEGSVPCSLVELN